MGRENGPMTIEREILRALREDCGVAPGDHLILGLSGGADSVCLLHCLNRCRGTLGICLSAVHVHHGIRREEADRDAAAAERMCRELGIPVRVFREDVPGQARARGISLEEAGRDIRRRRLAEERERAAEALPTDGSAADSSADLSADGEPALFRGEQTSPRVWVVLAHHMDDQAETMLLQLARGSGLRGLGGMSPREDFRIRPMLRIRRREIEEWLRREGIPWVEDTTNASDHYTRNRMRHHVLPVLEEEINARCVEHMAAAAEELREAEAWMAEQAGNWLAAHGTFREDFEFLAVPAEELRQCPTVLRRRVLLLLLQRAAGAERDLGRVHVEILEALLSGRTGASADLPRGLKGRRTAGELRIYREDPAGRAAFAAAEVSIPGEGTRELTVEGVRYRFTVFSRQKDEKIPRKRYTKWFDYDKINHCLSVRSRRTGDVIALAGVGRKQVRRYLIDAGVPAEERDRVPLLADGDRVLWIVGIRSGDGARITEETRRILEVHAEMPEEEHET